MKESDIFLKEFTSANNYAKMSDTCLRQAVYMVGEVWWNVIYIYGRTSVVKREYNAYVYKYSHCYDWFHAAQPETALSLMVWPMEQVFI